MKEEHHGDGVTTFVFVPDDPTPVTLLEVRHAVERIETMCRDILTTLSLMVELLPEVHGKSDADEG